MVIKPNDEIEEVDGVLSCLKCTYYYNPGGTGIPSYKMLIDALFCDSIPQYGKPDTWPVHDLPLRKRRARIDPDSVGSKLCIPGVLVECEFKREESVHDDWQHVPTDNRDGEPVPGCPHLVMVPCGGDIAL